MKHDLKVAAQSAHSLPRISMLRRMIAQYDPAKVSAVLSPSETMLGENYMWVGESAIEAIITAISASQLSSVETVLDLPCGHGRVLRHLVKLFPKAQFDVCDLDESGVDFCASEFAATAVPAHTDLTKTAFPRKYDLIWIGSLFTHLPQDKTMQWLSFLSHHLTEKGIIVATFHGRWAMKMQELIPYTDAKRWDEVKRGYDLGGYGFVDYAPGLGHEFVPGTYGVSAVRPFRLLQMIEHVVGTRIILFQEKGWADNHDVLAFGRPDVLDHPEFWPS